jgi:hypothetical protein
MALQVNAITKIIVLIASRPSADLKIEGKINLATGKCSGDSCQ